MLTTTRKKPLKKISEITFDLEIINPIESKNLFGGCDYKWDCGCNDNLWWHNPNPSGNFDGPGGFIGFSSSSNSGGDNVGGGSYGGYYDTNYDSNYDGIDDADDLDNNGIIDSEQSIPNLPATVPMQLNTLGSCVSYAISFISNYLGNQTNPLNVAYNIDKTLGLAFNTALFQSTAFSSGLDPAQATQAIQSFFNTTPVTNIQQVTAALQSGHPVIANYITSQATPENGNTITAHEIVIVNYNQWNFQIANSLTGSYQWISQDLITFQNGAFEINSLRP